MILAQIYQLPVVYLRCEQRMFWLLCAKQVYALAIGHSPMCYVPKSRFTISQPANNLGPLSAHQRNAIFMAFRWWAESGPLLNDSWNLTLLVFPVKKCRSHRPRQYARAPCTWWAWPDRVHRWSCHCSPHSGCELERAWMNGPGTTFAALAYLRLKLLAPDWRLLIDAWYIGS